jgi:predicted murein hydrolase (TIGR00659 family)
MKSIFFNSVYFGILASISGYALGIFLKKKFKWGIFNPLLVSIIFVIVILLVFHIDFKSYNEGAKYLSFLLTPATVCLAIPLYQQLDMLKKNVVAVVIGISTGVLSSLCSILAMSVIFNLSHQQYVTLLPKSITTAIGIGVSGELGGITTITVAVIILTGVFGNIIAEFVLKLFRIKHPIAVGLALGTASHAIGTSKALEMGEIEGAMGSLSIAVSGLMTVVGASVFANFR